jgi:OOP family OmpA-OmpF porin
MSPNKRHLTPQSKDIPMSNQHTWRLLSAAALGCLVALPSHAQDAGTFYGGAAIGRSQARIDEDRISSGLLGSGLATSAMSRDEKDTGYKLFGGYQLTPHFGLEAGYFKLGRFGFTATTVPAGTLTGRIQLQGVNLDLVGTWPVTERFALLGRLGAQYAEAKDRFRGTGAVGVTNPDPSHRELNPKFGVGLQYALSPAFLVRGEAERYRVNDAVGNHGGVNLFSVSLVFPFGRAPAAHVAAAPAYVAAPVAEPPPAAPPAAPPPPPPTVVAPTPRRVSVSADTLFGFNEATVQPQGQAALDKLAHDLNGTRVDAVRVEGHTDRLGSDRYNQALSLRRAEAVKAHLVASGLDAGKVSAMGKGESVPVTTAAQCKGQKPSPALIACLKPDRRVVVEVTGTR